MAFLTCLVYRKSILNHTSVLNLMYQFMHKNFQYKYNKFQVDFLTVYLTSQGI